MGFDYFYEDQSQQFAFYRIPKVLFTDARFQGISTEGKVLYGLLLDRVSLSRDNGWIDEEGRVYIIFTLTSIRETMNCSEKSAIKYLSELEEFGLIEQCTIYTSAVGTFNMTELVAAGCQCWLGDKVAERTGILHLTHTYQRTSHG